MDDRVYRRQIAKATAVVRRLEVGLKNIRVLARHMQAGQAIADHHPDAKDIEDVADVALLEAARIAEGAKAKPFDKSKK